MRARGRNALRHRRVKRRVQDGIVAMWLDGGRQRPGSFWRPIMRVAQFLVPLGDKVCFKPTERGGA
jgi:hypothetical protein